MRLCRATRQSTSAAVLSSAKSSSTERGKGWLARNRAVARASVWKRTARLTQRAISSRGRLVRVS